MIATATGENLFLCRAPHYQNTNRIALFYYAVNAYDLIPAETAQLRAHGYHFATYGARCARDMSAKQKYKDDKNWEYKGKNTPTPARAVLFTCKTVRSTSQNNRHRQDEKIKHCEFHIYLLSFLYIACFAFLQYSLYCKIQLYMLSLFLIEV